MLLLKILARKGLNVIACEVAVVVVPREVKNH